MKDLYSMTSNFEGSRVYEFIKSINFVRVGGTPEEKKAADIIKRKLDSFKIETSYQDFTLATSYGSKSEFKFLEPYEKTVEISQRVISGGTPAGGLVTGFKYIDSGGERYCNDIEGKVVMTTGRLDRVLYERLTRNKVVAVIVPMGYGQKIYGITFNIDFVKKFGELPVCFMNYDDALEMVRNNVSKVFIKIEDKSDHNSTGRNVIGIIPGSFKPEEEILLVAHYDSTLNTGIYDNAAGTATLVEMARYFSKNPPKRTLKFIFFTGEELGLRGSKAFIKDLKDKQFDLYNIKLVINFDLGGPILGRNCIRVTGNEEMSAYIKGINFVEDWDFLVTDDIYSSDNMPFGLEGIPAINIYRESLGLGHSWNDTIDHISSDAFNILGAFTTKLLSGIINATNYPFKRKISKEIKHEITKYFNNSSVDEPREEED